MSCPTCGHTMQQALAPVWWCPRCGTLKTNNRDDALGTHEPWLVQRIVTYFEALDGTEDTTVARSAVEECCKEGFG